MDRSLGLEISGTIPTEKSVAVRIPHGPLVKIYRRLHKWLFGYPGGHGAPRRH